MQVFAGIFPIDASEHETLQQAIDKLTLNDASVSVTKTRRYIVYGQNVKEESCFLPYPVLPTSQ
jgi:translation elongation factor EF-4